MEEELMQPILSPIKQGLVDRIMHDFWLVSNQEGEASLVRSPTTVSVCSAEDQNGNTCSRAGSSSIGASDLSGASINTNREGNRNSLGRRGREDEDDQEENDGAGRGPKRLKTLSSPPRSPDNRAKFACPYRKRDPRKYCVKFWRSCALAPQDTVARVKGHLYRHHRIFPCQRCKAIFKDQEAVNAHLMEQDVCKRRDIDHADGVTTEIVEKLRSKKKAQKDQTEADRWKEIYKLLFPNEMIPSPYFEEVQEDSSLSPDSKELDEYEQYCRRELPRRVRAALQEIVHHQAQPIEESIRNQLMNIIRDCQDHVFSSYRASSVQSSVQAVIGTPVPDITLLRSPTVSTSHIMLQRSEDKPSEFFNETSERELKRAALPCFQPPSPQRHLQSALEVSVLQDDTIAKTSDGSDTSDSGYGSQIQSQTTSFLPGGSSFDNASDLSTLLPFAPFPGSEQATWDMHDNLPTDMGSGNLTLNLHDDGSFGSSWLDCNFQSEGNYSWDPTTLGAGIDYRYEEWE